MVPMTLRSVERGGAGVTIGAYLAVMQVLGIEQDLEQLAAADPLGRELQDARLRPHRGAASTPPAAPHEAAQQLLSAATDTGQARAVASASPTRKGGKQRAPAPRPGKKRAARTDDRRWAEQSGFASSAALAVLLEPGTQRAKKRR